MSLCEDLASQKFMVIWSSSNREDAHTKELQLLLPAVTCP